MVISISADFCRANRQVKYQIKKSILSNYDTNSIASTLWHNKAGNASGIDYSPQTYRWSSEATTFCLFSRAMLQSSLFQTSYKTHLTSCWSCFKCFCQTSNRKKLISYYLVVTLHFWMFNSLKTNSLDHVWGWLPASAHCRPGPHENNDGQIQAWTEH